VALTAVLLWNEPNNLSHWDFTIDPAWAMFAAMIRRAAAAVRAEAPHLPVVLGGLAPLDPGFLQLVLQRHGLEAVVDAVGVHGFPFDWHLWQVHEWPDKVAALRRHTQKPLWATEVGVSSFGCEEVQVLGLRKTLAVLPPLVEEVFWYSLYDLPPAVAATTRHREAEGSAYYRHYAFGLLDQHGRPKLALRHFPPEFGLCQWIQLGDEEQLEGTASWLTRLGVRKLRTGLSWADSHVPGAWDFFDRMMRAFAPFEVTATLCFTPPSRGIRPDPTSPPLDVDEFAAFCQAVARRFR
jgi:beta-xylosidase